MNFSETSALLQTLALRPADRKLIKDFWETLIVVTAVGLWLIFETAWYVGRFAIQRCHAARRWWDNGGRAWVLAGMRPTLIALLQAAAWLLEVALPYVEENAGLWLYWIAELPADCKQQLAQSYGKRDAILVIDKVFGLA